MRKHSVRKWLHAILDLLPVIILPIFAIYSHRHTIDSYEVTVPQNVAIEFNQQIDLVDYSSLEWIRNVNSYTIEIDNDRTSYIYLTQEYNLTADNIYVFKCKSDMLGFRTTANGDFPYVDAVDFYNGYSISFTATGNTTQEIVVHVSDYSTTGYSTLKFNLFNLTQMFGSGNEPSLQDFNALFPNFYDYDLGTKQLLKGVSTVTYDNSDIGSQMLYSLYKPINDYFNLNNVFNFGAIYDWFELNMFNGNAPLSIFIVWNIIVYEFIMDIIFLIYSVFMFVIDFACETLDRFTGWAKRGD